MYVFCKLTSVCSDLSPVEVGLGSAICSGRGNEWKVSPHSDGEKCTTCRIIVVKRHMYAFHADILFYTPLLLDRIRFLDDAKKQLLKQCLLHPGTHLWTHLKHWQRIVVEYAHYLEHRSNNESAAPRKDAKTCSALGAVLSLLHLLAKILVRHAHRNKKKKNQLPANLIENVGNLPRPSPEAAADAPPGTELTDQQSAPSTTVSLPSSAILIQSVTVSVSATCVPSLRWAVSRANTERKCE